MDIYILRHGEAEPRGRHRDDAVRRLTPKGKRDIARVMRLACAAKVRPDLILTSPFVRAADSARIAREICCPSAALEEAPVLLPDSAPDAVWKEVRSHRRSRQVMLVGHEPQLSLLVAYLLACPGLRMELKKGALVRIRFEKPGAEPRGLLKWTLTPAIARVSRKLAT